MIVCNHLKKVTKLKFDAFCFVSFGLNYDAKN